jgi:hypothetical protein
MSTRHKIDLRDKSISDLQLPFQQKKTEESARLYVDVEHEEKEKKIEKRERRICMILCVSTDHNKLYLVNIFIYAFYLYSFFIFILFSF